jgi:hypothetical protein
VRPLITRLATRAIESVVVARPIGRTLIRGAIRTAVAGIARPAVLACATVISRGTLITWRRPTARGTLIAVAEAARRLFVAIAAHSCGKAPPLFVARDIESRSRIPVLPPRPPLGAAPFATLPLGLRLLGRFPEPPPCEPLQHDVGMFGLQLLEGRHEIVALVRAKGRGLSFENDRPVCEAWRHAIPTPAAVRAA